MLPLLILTLSLTTTTSSTLQLPIRDVLTLEDPELSVLDFIRLSYQPLLFLEALSRNTLAALTPWTFPSLSTSLEAATTFCVASTGSLNHNGDTETGEDVKRKSEKSREAGSVASKEKAETETNVGKRDEEKLDVGRKAMKEESRTRAETNEVNERNERKRQGKTEYEDLQERENREIETLEISKETEGRGKTISEAEEGGKEEAKKEKGKKKEIPMSLRRFGKEGPGRGWVAAFTSVTQELG